MRRPPLVLALFASVLALGACGGGGDDAASDENAGDDIAVELDQQNDSSVTGLRATLVVEGRSSTRIVVDGLDEGEPSGGGANPVHLHRGSCDEPAAGETVQLGELTGSESESVVDVPIGELVGGGYVVDVHLPPIGLQGDAEPEVIACGDLSDASQSAS
jgi:hypothetical protein